MRIIPQNRKVTGQNASPLGHSTPTKQRYNKNMVLHNPGSKLSPEPRHALSRISHSQPLELWENKSLLFEHPVCGSLLWNLKQTKTMCSILINCIEAQRLGFDISVAAKSLSAECWRDGYYMNKRPQKYWCDPLKSFCECCVPILGKVPWCLEITINRILSAKKFSEKTDLEITWVPINQIHHTSKFTEHSLEIRSADV